MNDKKIICNGPLTELAAKLKEDPDCKNDLLGGEIKFHMDLTEEHLN